MFNSIAAEFDRVYYHETRDYNSSMETYLIINKSLVVNLANKIIVFILKFNSNKYQLHRDKYNSNGRYRVRGHHRQKRCRREQTNNR